MPDPEIFRGADVEALQSLPKLNPKDREVLERMVVLAPDAAVATASAIIRTHQGDLHDLFFPRENHRPVLAQLSAALVYLSLAMSAPSQGKFMPILTLDHFRNAPDLSRQFMSSAGAAAAGGEAISSELIPDPELVKLLETFINRASARPDRDPRWARAMVYGAASAFYGILARVCAEQFRPSGSVLTATQQLERTARTRELVLDALASEDTAKPFNPKERAARIDRLREYGWQEFVASKGRTLAQIAAAAAVEGLQAYSHFALSEEWTNHGASQPTNGQRYFIRPALLPDSPGLTWRSQEGRLKPLQKILAGDPDETGLRIGVGSAEIYLEYLVRTGQRDFLVGNWTRTSNLYDRNHVRFGLVSATQFGVTLFPGARYDETVGVWPVIEVQET